MPARPSLISDISYPRRSLQKLLPFVFFACGWTYVPQFGAICSYLSIASVDTPGPIAYRSDFDREHIVWKAKHSIDESPTEIKCGKLKCH